MSKQRSLKKDKTPTYLPKEVEGPFVKKATKRNRLFNMLPERMLYSGEGILRVI